MKEPGQVGRWLAVVWLVLAAGARAQEYAPAAGDVVFQSLPHSALVDAIEGSTGSPYSHCGIVVDRGGKWYVLEAIGPVKETSLAQWVGQGRQGAFDAYRLREEYRDRIPQFVAAARRYIGRPYDMRYRFDDDLIYCSELVYKAFGKVSGERLGEVKRLGELHWESFVPVIMAIEGRIPKRRKMITPRDLANAKQLECVYRGIALQQPAAAME